MSEKKCPLNNFEKCIGNECAWFTTKKPDGSCAIALLGSRVALPLDFGSTRKPVS